MTRRRLLAPVLVCLSLAAPSGAVVSADAASAAPASATASRAVPTGAAVGTSGLDTSILGAVRRDARSRYLGGHLSASVVDLDTGRPLWSTNSTRPRMPASTQKVLTTYTVLRSTKPGRRLVTRAFQSTAAPGHVFLRGAGDPTLSRGRLAGLAAGTAARLRAQGRTSVDLYLDDTLFPRPTMPSGWKPSYISGGEVQYVRGLTLEGYRGGDATVAAGTVFRARLAAAGVTVRSMRRGAAPAGRRELAETSSTTVRAMVATMLSRSHNTYAEYLFRIAALDAGRYPSWRNARANMRRVLVSNHIPTAGLDIYDGSGLSRADRVATPTLTSTIAKLYGRDSDRSAVFVAGAMPVAARSGTLYSRYRSGAQACAAGRIAAKTGTLNDVVALAGVAHGIDGRDRVFAFIENGAAASKTSRNAIDTLAASTTGCRR